MPPVPTDEACSNSSIEERSTTILADPTALVAYFFVTSLTELKSKSFIVVQLDDGSGNLFSFGHAGQELGRHLWQQ